MSRAIAYTVGTLLLMAAISAMLPAEWNLRRRLAAAIPIGIALALVFAGMFAG